MVNRMCLSSAIICYFTNFEDIVVITFSDKLIEFSLAEFQINCASISAKEWLSTSVFWTCLRGLSFSRPSSG